MDQTTSADASAWDTLSEDEAIRRVAAAAGPLEPETAARLAEIFTVPARRNAPEVEPERAA